MKTTLKLTTIIFILSVLPFIAKADGEELAPPNVVANIPANSWEQHAQGVSVALNLAEWTDDGGHRKKGIKIYIKNTSNIDKYLMDATADFGIQIFYTNDQGSETLLHKYVDLLHPSALRVTASPVIKPGEVWVVSLGLAQNELDLLKAHLVKCVFFVSNQGLHIDTDDRNKIETSPKMLTEIIDK